MKLAVILCGGNFEQILNAKRFFESRQVHIVLMGTPKFDVVNRLQKEFNLAAIILSEDKERWEHWLKRNRIGVIFQKGSDECQNEKSRS